MISAIEFIAPELFGEVSKVTNAQGTLAQVVVQFVSRVDEKYTRYVNNHYKADAHTSVSQSSESEHVCYSLYGTNTITITIGYGCDEMKALGHELIPHSVLEIIEDAGH